VGVSVEASLHIMIVCYEDVRETSHLRYIRNILDRKRKMKKGAHVQMQVAFACMLEDVAWSFACGQAKGL
jgi:hypothetical protein